jgi:hypothetical protein
LAVGGLSVIVRQEVRGYGITQAPLSHLLFSPLQAALLPHMHVPPEQRFEL